MATAAIGLGSNEGDAARNVLRALAALARLGRVRAVSSLYRSRAWGVREQADFVNAAALLETTLAPRALLTALKGVEGSLGRVETYRWGPRIVDLDILAYDDVRVREPGLEVPHPRLHERAFALAPLAEIDARFRPALAALSPAARTEVERIASSPARSRPAVDWDEALARVRDAAAFCASAGLARFRVADDRFEIDVRRAPRLAATTPSPAAGESGAGAAPSSSNGLTHEPAAPAILRAEFVGIVRFSRPNVSEGSLVALDRELAYVEALGIRNPIRAGAAGRVSEVFVTDGQAVEFGQPLFAIEGA